MFLFLVLTALQAPCGRLNGPFGNVRFRGKSGHIWLLLKESANSHKRTYSIPQQLC